MSRPSSSQCPLPAARSSSGPEPDYRALVRECFVQHPEQVTELITDAGLRGRGGAGFLTGLKWRLCTSAPGHTKYVICNADEGEPGTFRTASC